MSFLSIGDSSSVNHEPSFLEENAGDSIREDSSFSEISKVVLEAIQASQKMRTVKIGHELNQRMVKLENEMGSLNKIFLTIAELYNKKDRIDVGSSSDEERDKLQASKPVIIKGIRTNSDEARSSIRKVIEEGKDLEISEGDFSDFWTINKVEENQRDLAVRFLTEKLLNVVVNRVCFLREVEVNMYQHRREIVHSFSNQPLSEPELEEFQVELSKNTSETHNRGRFAVEAVVSSKSKQLFTVFYKPRDAFLDQEILSLFHKINELPDGAKSLNVSLPTYKIINLEEDGEVFSVWEFIKGEKKAGAAADYVIQSFPRPHHDMLKQQLLRLESICRPLGISDLHLDNIIFKDVKEDGPHIIPIDLESIQLGSSTGLFGEDPDLPPLSKEESELLRNFQQNIPKMPFRFVPLPTSNFLGGLSSFNSFIVLGEALQESIEKKGFKLCCSPNELKLLVLEDFLHNDVPYLTEYGSGIYYGGGKNKKVIAER